MGALTPDFRSEKVNKRTEKGKTLVNVTVAACAHSRWGSYMNNCHMRTYVTEGASTMQPVGTTSNEALHEE